MQCSLTEICENLTENEICDNYKMYQQGRNSGVTDFYNEFRREMERYYMKNSENDSCLADAIVELSIIAAEKIYKNLKI